MHVGAHTSRFDQRINQRQNEAEHHRKVDEDRDEMELSVGDCRADVDDGGVEGDAVEEAVVVSVAVTAATVVVDLAVLVIVEVGRGGD